MCFYRNCCKNDHPEHLNGLFSLKRCVFTVSTVKVAHTEHSERPLPVQTCVVTVMPVETWPLAVQSPSHLGQSGKGRSLWKDERLDRGVCSVSGSFNVYTRHRAEL